ncbi:nickel ABC transporter substrate-binding protein [Halalkalibacterium halodurans]|uniref:Nickel transport system (Nickel-binding protein) n=1 Tax=Halalkalibacterium halodurans (strain ATCC BAA-125 / DSM 18197 / FERM 7344 / JCM 9153 / C-125) TaxID=272558 RepID=Q9KFB8_HALH5|nr:nickel ABC transporter substrate-binding protein [Halalkalibacterium halodurans]MDY7221063.1 nickel ABC transporter substrate-binding protein [Halalkalibacterium halodurans]MDY7240302.1 nickel ABC transporter substrate-binding protein [Halalkalibacterium halodurans]MED4124572.1 nickel ABC transporter substrate-binding protein [Halalkalibacterium halodurans]MED4173170.1 nickel ABC transporter substrate-binding protein [Halalkalibacterium halodurans]BAB04286.1 nickel transport system (nickel-
MCTLNRKLILLFVISLISSILVGCAESESGTVSNEGEENTEKSITFSWPRDIGPMNPHVYNPSQLFAQSMIYEPLVSYTEGGELQPHLADSWTISEDGKEYTFKLREGVQFSDGTPFNAEIVKKNFDTWIEHSSLHSWLGVMNVLEKTEVVDEFTFKMVLKEPYYPALQDLAVVRPVRFLGEAGFPDDGDTSQGIKEPIGTGPWMLSDYKQDEYAVFTRNPNYWGESPKIDKVTVKIIPDAETRVLAFESGELDLIFGEGVISMDAFNQLKESGQYGTDLSEPVGTRSLLLNTSNEKLADLRVRLALHHGFNKQAMVEGVTLGLEEKADNILSTNFPYTDIDVEPIEYDVEQANAYLDEAGWELPAGKTVREKNGEQLELELIYDKTDPLQKAMAETMQAEWAAIGVKLDITGLELTTQIQRRRAGDFDVDFWYNYGAPYDPHSFINVVAEAGWGVAEAHSNLSMKEELDEQVRATLASTDETERQELYGSILNTLQEQSVFVPISYIKKTVVYQENVNEFIFPANRDEHPFNGIDVSN